ncbi:hypothetical protein KFE25_008025 [Diacronema lutheri]|uniref:CS domain-containing protein n=1 Tax=Diacronema lutheri TaxID=2081491 RepID=A0A8J5XDD9_DIALT|nr:hypothetical protein KFE25_008025 [Diacronema lutheri]
MLVEAAPAVAANGQVAGPRLRGASHAAALAQPAGPAGDDDVRGAIERNRARGWTPDDVRWHAWIGTRGSDVVVTDTNVHRYARIVSTPPEPSGSPRAPVAAAAGRAPAGAHARAPPPSAGLGADLGLYSWTQTVKRVELTVPVPAGSRARQLVVVMQRAHICVGRVGEPPIVNAALAMPIYVGGGADEDGSYWELVDGRAVVLHLSKWHSRERANCRDASETWWRSCFADEPPCALPAPPVAYYLARDADEYDERACRPGGGVQYAG